MTKEEAVRETLVELAGDHAYTVPASELERAIQNARKTK